MFKEKIFEKCKKIPKGKVSTYGEIAKAIGQPRSYRAVGNVLHGNNDKKIPCHRIIRSDGSVGNYNKGRLKKVELLKKERVIVWNNKIDLKKFLFKNF